MTIATALEEDHVREKGPGFDAVELVALDDNQVPDEDRPVIRQVFKSITYDTARLWQRLRKDYPLASAELALAHGFSQYDEMSHLAGFPDGIPAFDGVDDGWAQARQMRDACRFDVGWAGEGDTDECTVDALTAEYAILDYETTGKNPYVDRVVEVATTRIRGDGTVLERWQSLVHPERLVGWSTEIHGITDADVEDADPWSKVAPRLWGRLDGAIVVAHSATYEEHMLASETWRLGYQVGPLATLDTKRLAGQYWPEVKSRALGKVTAHLGIKNPQAHRAQADTDTTAELLAMAIGRACQESDGAFGFRVPVPNRFS